MLVTCPVMHRAAFRTGFLEASRVCQHDKTSLLLHDPVFCVYVIVCVSVHAGACVCGCGCGCGYVWVWVSGGMFVPV